MWDESSAGVMLSKVLCRLLTFRGQDEVASGCVLGNARYTAGGLWIPLLLFETADGPSVYSFAAVPVMLDWPPPGLL